MASFQTMAGVLCVTRASGRNCRSLFPFAGNFSDTGAARAHR